MSFCEAPVEMTTDIQEPHCRELEALNDTTLPTSSLGYSPPLKLDVEDFKCSICLHLWHKPCMSACGHVFCFWCIHLAMNGLGPSQCPLCRAPYAHLPSICVPLHHFVTQQFPEESHERSVEVTMEEARIGVHSPALPALPHYVTLEGTFACADCGLLAYEPVVTICGHLFCRSCVERLMENGPVRCPGDDCAVHIKVLPNLCIVLHELLEMALPQRYAARGREVREGSMDAGMLAMPDGSAALRKGEEPSLPPFSPIEELEKAQQDPHYVHYGIICDACGAYPIIGYRWRCQDCPEKIGFDICGDCHDHQVHKQILTGKFSQTHQPSHRMMLMEQPKDWLHQLKSLHPELSMTQLWNLLSVALQEVQRADGGSQGEVATGGDRGADAPGPEPQ